MSLEKTASNPLVDGQADDFSEGKHTLLLLLKLLGLFDGLEEEGLERVQRVLVHGVDDAKLDLQEVKHGTLSSNASVDLSELVDVGLSLNCDSLLFGNTLGSLFGCFETLDELDVVQNGGHIGCDQVCEQVSLQFGNLDLEVVLLTHKFFLSLLEFRLLDSDNHCKKLVFKTALCDDEVDDRAHSSSLGTVVGVRQFSLQVQLEAIGDFDVLRTNLDVQSAALLGVSLLKQRIEEGIDRFADCLDHEDLTSLDGHFNLALPSVLGQLHRLHLCTFTSLDPLNTLQLWIDDQRIPSA